MLGAGQQYQRVIMQNAAVATGVGTAVETTGMGGGYEYLAMQVTGISGDTVTFEATVDGTNWIALRVTPIATGTVATTATANGIYQAIVRGLAQVRANITTRSAGTITVVGVAV